MSDNGTRPDDHKPDYAKIAFRIAVGVVLAAGLFLGGLYSGATKNTVYWIAKGVLENTQLASRETRNLVEPVHFLQPARFDGSGVTVNAANDGQLILMSGFFEGGTALKLMRRDGEVVANWPAPYSSFFPQGIQGVGPKPKTDWNIDIHGMLMEQDGSVLFNFEYAGLVKLSPCGDVIWTVAHPTHHSVVRAEQGGYWVPGLQALTDNPQYQQLRPFVGAAPEEVLNELILHVSDNGEILQFVPVLDLLFDSGLEPMLTATGYSFTRGSRRIPDVVHINKISELSTAAADEFEAFEAGYLALSSRKYNAIFVVDPTTWKVVWHQVGPWKRQHDPEFLPTGEIAVFNNNTYRIDLANLERTDLTAPRRSNIVILDPRTRAHRTFPETTVKGGLHSVMRGKIDPTGDGGFLITEFEAGRVLELDRSGNVTWEYINRYNSEFVAEITEAQLYRESDFAKGTWSCDT